MSLTTRSILSHSLVLTIAGAIANLGQLIVFATAARSLGVQQFGVEASIAASVIACAALFDFGSNLRNLKDLASSEIALHGWFRLFANKIGVNIILASALYIPLTRLIGERFALSACIYFTSVTVFTALLIPFRSRNMSWSITLSTLADKSVTVTLVVFLTPHTSLVENLALGQIAGVCAIAVALWNGCRSGSFGTSPYSGRGKPIFKIENPWSRSLKMGLVQLTPILQRSMAPFLFTVIGDAAAGIYAAVANWTNPLGLLATAYTQAITPDLARLKSADKLQPALIRSSWMLAVPISISLVVAVLSEPIVKVILGNAFLDSAGVLSIIAVATAFGVVNQPVSMALQMLDRGLSVSIVLALALALQVSAVLCTGDEYGAASAAYGLLAAQAFTLGTLGWLLHRSLWDNSRAG